MIGPPPGAGWFARRTVTGLAGALRAGTTSPADLVERSLAEAARLDPGLNALAAVDAPGARAAAERAGRELSQGLDRGPLHGIPVAVKDVVDTAGLRTAMGSRHHAGRVPGHDAECVRRLRASGAIIVGKAATHEFAFGPTGDRSADGATRNPYRRERVSGGSSSGSAAAVAAGIVPLAVGTDTGGSVRIPAACCGIVGLKPTRGAVPSGGVFPVAPSLDTVGPMARTAGDCLLLWNVLAGEDAPEPDISGCRVGWVAPSALHPADPRVTEAVRPLLEPLPVREVAVPDIARLRWAYQVIQGREVHTIHAGRLAAAPELYGEEVLARLRAAGRITEEDAEAAQAIRERVHVAVAALLERHDLLAMPTVPILPPPLDARSVSLGGTPIDVRAALLSLTSPWSVLGLPAISLPAAPVDGLPTGLQLIARPGAERLLLAVAGRLSEANQTTPTASQP
ncbi:amidase [Actinomadura madurae]|uniref:amidase n=1 Tax=Actinomadura madurae TaxID=1993 RepID=UPI002026AF78|nr:amidase [Actinomadura madurae]URM97687.1 amidase [Actinomadura madurae]